MFEDDSVNSFLSESLDKKKVIVINKKDIPLFDYSWIVPIII